MKLALFKDQLSFSVDGESGSVGFSVKRRETGETIGRLGKAQGLEIWLQHTLVLTTGKSFPSPRCS